MVVEGRHQSHEVKVHIRILGEIPHRGTRKTQESIKTFLTTPSQNFGKDIYIIDLDDHEKTYWLATESGLLGAFHFDGDSPSQRAVGFALMSGGSRRRGHELESPGVSSPVRMLRRSPRPRESTVFDR